MTIKLEHVELLLESMLNRQMDNLERTKAEIKVLELELESKKVHVTKLSFFIDKFSKFAETIEMDKNNEKPFEEIHKDLF
ncbi:hypothetical protein KAU33_09215 [Candidatus Dependentiae bacterium]|nr:hypothetical protein [Candidatus Dependentiae bacterium]